MTVPVVRRAAFFITNGGDAAVKNAQAPTEDVNVEGSFGGERRESEGNIKSVGMRGIK